MKFFNRRFRSLIVLSLFALVAIFGTARAQQGNLETITTATEQDNSLNYRFNKLMGKSSDYQQYKVIKKTEIEQFWLDVIDTVNTRNREIQRLETRINLLQVNIDTLESRVSGLNTALEASQEKNDEIGFLGSSLSKATYHFIVWGIIVVLVVVLIIVYFMYINSNTVTARFKKDNEQMRKEFDDHRDKSREIQVRLKRELQTANNTIEEMKRGGSVRR